MNKFFKFYIILTGTWFLLGKNIHAKEKRLLRVAVYLIGHFSVLRDPAVNLTTEYKPLKKNQIDGVEVAAFELIAKSLKLKIKYYAKKQELNGISQGQVYKNNSLTELFHDLKVGPFDAAIGFIKTIPYLENHFQMTPWLMDDLIFCMRKHYAIGNLNPFGNMLTPEVETLFLPVIFLITAILWKMSSKVICFSQWFYIAILASLGAAVNLPKRKGHCTASGGLILFGSYMAMLIQSIWLTQLSSGKTTYLFLAPSTVNELFENNMTLYYHPYDIHFFNDILKSKVNNLGSHPCNSIKECLNLVTENSNSFTILPKLLIGSIKNVEKFRNEIRCFKTSYVKYKLAFLFKNEIVWANQFAKKLKYLYEYGLLIPHFKKFKPMPFMASDKVIGNVLGLKHLTLIFYFFILGIAFGFNVFLLEHLVFWITRRLKN